MRAALKLGIVVIFNVGCIDSSRVNPTCTWTETSLERLDPSTSADREHLRVDAQLAGELGQRLADVHYRHRPDLGDPIQERCTAALIDTIARRHGVSLSTVKAAAMYRVWWADLLLVYLPLAAVVALSMDIITRRICRSFDPEHRAVAMACVAMFVAVMALLGLGVGQFWGFNMEGVFLRNDHIAFRAFLVPIIRHGWVGYFSLLAWCAVVAVVRFARTPLRKVERSYASLYRPSSSARIVGLSEHSADGT